jgi:transcriptional regulator with PAS, ATPase and Fis domain
MSTQAKLLRALQERKITPIGGTQPVPIDIHLIAATNKNLKTMSHEGTFREDLFFRLNIIPIELPPLRERTQDIPILIRHFLKKYTREIGKHIRGVAPDVMSFLEQYAYPGNVRELENIIERAVVLAEVDIIRNEDLELWDSGAETLSNGAESLIERIPMNAEELKEMKRHIRDHAIESLESLFVRNALDRNGWNVTRAAEETGILRPNFQGMMKKLGISVRGQH